jgi:outer membrane lipoprotein-sorting protein
MKRKLAIVLTLVVVIGGAIAPSAQPPTADQIMQMAENRFQGNDYQAQIQLDTTNAQGQTRTLQIEMKGFLYDKPNAKYKILVSVTAPADLKGLAFLVWENKYPKPDDRWLYQPTLKNVKKIEPENARTSLFGSIFNYEDVNGRPAEADTHKLLRSEKIDGREAWVIESTPKNPNVVDFGRRLLWVDQETLIILREELYDKQKGELWRVLKTIKQEKIDAIWTTVMQSVENVQTKTKSAFSASNVKYNAGLPESLFDPNNLGK